MGAALLLLLQAVAGTLPERIDLTLPATSAGCAERPGDDIVVCGGRGDSYRLAPLAERRGSAPILKAETKLFGAMAAGAIETEAAAMPNGAQSNRLMARIKLPF